MGPYSRKFRRFSWGEIPPDHHPIVGKALKPVITPWLLSFKLTRCLSLVIFLTLKHTWPSTCTQWHSQKGSKTCWLVLGTISTLEATPKLCETVRFRRLVSIYGLAGVWNRFLGLETLKLGVGPPRDPKFGDVLFRYWVSFCSGCHRIYYRIGRNVWDFAWRHRILLQIQRIGRNVWDYAWDTARPTSVFYHDHLEQ